MARFRRLITLATGAASLVGAGLVPSALTSSAVAAQVSGTCSAGAHTLASYGSRLYPETGNGGYTSVHTDVHMVYDASANAFLPGNSVALTDQATQCLTSFSLDFERTSANTAAGPDMSVSSVTVNGRAARFAFEQPTYPGDPKGPGDPDPLAHEASQTNPVGGPDSNPLPPAWHTGTLTAHRAPMRLNASPHCIPASPIRQAHVYLAVTTRPGPPPPRSPAGGSA